MALIWLARGKKKFMHSPETVIMPAKWVIRQCRADQALDITTTYAHLSRILVNKEPM